MEGSHDEVTSGWDAWAHYDKGVFLHIGSRWYVDLHGLDLPVVEVRVELDPDGMYWGWQDTGKESELPEMIWPEECLLAMCFPCGFMLEEELGRGWHVRMAISKKEAADE